MTNNTDPVRALIGQWRDAAEFFTGDAGSDIRETLMACARELEAALAAEQQQPMGMVEAFEEYHKADVRDPAVALEWKWWQAAWKAALAAQPGGAE